MFSQPAKQPEPVSIGIKEVDGIGRIEENDNEDESQMMIRQDPDPINTHQIASQSMSLEEPPNGMTHPVGNEDDTDTAEDRKLVNSLQGK